MIAYHNAVITIAVYYCQYYPVVSLSYIVYNGGIGGRVKVHIKPSKSSQLPKLEEVAAADIINSKAETALHTVNRDGLAA